MLTLEKHPVVCEALEVQISATSGVGVTEAAATSDAPRLEPLVPLTGVSHGYTCKSSCVFVASFDKDMEK